MERQEMTPRERTLLNTSIGLGVVPPAFQRAVRISLLRYLSGKKKADQTVVENNRQRRTRKREFDVVGALNNVAPLQEKRNPTI
jgi:hypothetical protein